MVTHLAPMVIIMEFKLVDTDAVIFTRLLSLCGNLKDPFKPHFRVHMRRCGDCRCSDYFGSHASPFLLPSTLHTMERVIFLNCQSDHVSYLLKIS